jgi:hypothetical protein
MSVVEGNIRMHAKPSLVADIWCRSFIADAARTGTHRMMQCF